METKQRIRERIWKLLEQKKASRFPGARGRIPNFVGSESCARRLNELPEWQNAKVIKSNPDSPQRQIRYEALKSGKILYMAVPRLASEQPFVELNPKHLRKNLYEASSIKGAFRLGKPVSIEQMHAIDLIVCGSVAVNEFGERIGKGEGYSELEFALTVEAGKLNRNVPVITTIHPLQIILERIERMRHDFNVDMILTPEEIIRCPKDKKRPKGIYWKDLSEKKIQEIPALQIIR
ncbi:MAG TPA: 5-formyltetrahydrofolate cyclo-ligase [Acidobacteriota bacterium]|nr:5-formyltetrahydrofolate cyclo-ligase [Acidobacteriota bacterium]